LQPDFMGHREFRDKMNAYNNLLDSQKA
jgi:hypothetical protein